MTEWRNGVLDRTAQYQRPPIRQVQKTPVKEQYDDRVA